MNATSYAHMKQTETEPVLRMEEVYRRKGIVLEHRLKKYLDEQQTNGSLLPEGLQLVPAEYGQVSVAALFPNEARHIENELRTNDGKASYFQPPTGPRREAITLDMIWGKIREAKGQPLSEREAFSYVLGAAFPVVLDPQENVEREALSWQRIFMDPILISGRLFFICYGTKLTGQKFVGLNGADNRFGWAPDESFLYRLSD